MIVNQNNHALSVGLSVVVCTLAALALLAAVMPAAAEAATSLGDNLKDELSSIGKGLLIGVVALVGIPALVRRDLGQAMVIMLISLVLGGFLWADTTVEAIVRRLWEALG